MKKKVFFFENIVFKFFKNVLNILKSCYKLKMFERESFSNKFEVKFKRFFFKIEIKMC